MKKYVSIIVVALVVICLVACGKRDKNRSEYEDIDNGFGEALKVAHYDELEMTFFFEGDDKTLNCIDIYNANATLFGEKILGRSEREVVSLLVANKYYEQDIETEAWGERRVSFGEGNIDLFFADNKLVSISIGS